MEVGMRLIIRILWFILNDAIDELEQRIVAGPIVLKALPDILIKVIGGGFAA
jgi:hypothetical protein